MMIWIHTEAGTRFEALDVIHVVMDRTRSTNQAGLFREVVRDLQVRKDSARALSRDFRDEKAVDQPLIHLIALALSIGQFTHTEAKDHPLTHRERSVFWGAVVACNRQLCSGTHSGDIQNGIFAGVSSYML